MFLMTGCISFFTAGSISQGINRLEVTIFLVFSYSFSMVLCFLGRFTSPQSTLLTDKILSQELGIHDDWTLIELIVRLSILRELLFGSCRYDVRNFSGVWFLEG